MGTLVKRHLAAALGWDPARIYHATVMPCYDKKLEASREDFYLLGELRLLLSFALLPWGLGLVSSLLFITCALFLYFQVFF